MVESRDQIKAIGGYFELELRKGEHYHKDALKLNTARNCFEYVLKARKYKKVYMPYYTCEVMFQPLEKLDIEYTFYHINEQFEISDLPTLSEGEAILYTNYFALKQSYVDKLVTHFGNKLIVDNAQAFYAPRIEGIDTFYSARKFFGVPDGAYLYTDCYLDDELEQDVSIERMTHLLKRIEFSAESGYTDFRNADDALDYQPIKIMSKLTEKIMCGIDYERVRIQRQTNFNFLNSILSASNGMLLSIENDVVPMAYPYLSYRINLRPLLIENKLFIPKYWTNIVDSDNFSQEYIFKEQLLSLPIDQRYSESDYERLISIL